MPESNVKLREIECELAKRNLLYFTKYTNPNYSDTWFHTLYANKLNDFAAGKIKKLAVFIPPQHGKSEISTRRLPAFLLGKNPNIRIAIVSYNAPFARKFNREIQRIIDSDEYREVFPKTTLNGSNVSTVAGGWLRNADECEIVGHRGSFKAVGVGGALTGMPVDVLIMDDLYKDAMSAWSSTVRGNIEDWYATVADTRLHNDSQQLIVYTRWHHEDLAGKLLKREGYDWEVCVFPALKIGDPTESDPREDGEPLWPEKHSRAKLLKSRDRDPHVFESLYQQNPKPRQGLMYSSFKTYTQNECPQGQILNYTDTADQGGDFLCSISYIKHGSLFYVVDVYFSKAPNEVTEPELSRWLFVNQTNQCRIESNNGGRSFARNIERISKEIGNYKVKIQWFNQSKNKDVRIKTNSSTVNNCIVFPDDWAVRWRDFYDQVTNYMAEGTNKHDDGPDVLTGIIEQNSNTLAPPILYS